MKTLSLDEYPFQGDSAAAIERARGGGLDWVLDDQLYIYSARNGSLEPADFDRRMTVDPESPCIVLDVRLGQAFRLSHGVVDRGLAFWFHDADHGHLERIVNALLQNGPLRDTGSENGTRSWQDRVLDGQYFDVRNLWFRSGSNYDVERIEGDGFNPAWITQTQGSTIPDDLPNADLPKSYEDGWNEVDRDLVSGRSIFSTYADANTTEFEVREADGTVLHKCFGSRGDVQFVDAHLFFVNGSEGHRVRLQEPHKEIQTVTDLPPYTPEPPDFNRFDLSETIVPTCFDGDAIAAVTQAAAMGYTYVVDNGMNPYRLRFGTAAIRLVPPNKRRGGSADHTEPFSMHALFHRDDDKINAERSDGWYLTFPATNSLAQRLEDVTRWVNALRPGRAIRYEDDTVLGGKRFEVRTFHMLDANPWRHPYAITTEVNPDRFTIT